MDVQQCMKLTGTNSSIGLITLISQCPSSSKKDETKPKTSSRFLRSAGLVAIAGTQTPDPIPNSEVKRPSANGTASQDVGESVAARPAKRKKILYKKPNIRGVEQPGEFSDH